MQSSDGERLCLVFILAGASEQVSMLPLHLGWGRCRAHGPYSSSYLHPADQCAHCLVSITSKDHEATSARGAASPVAPKHNPAPQPFPQPALLSFHEATASPDHSSSSPGVRRGTCPEKVPGFCCGPRAASTDLPALGQSHPPGCH